MTRGFLYNPQHVGSSCHGPTLTRTTPSVDYLIGSNGHLAKESMDALEIDSSRIKVEYNFLFCVAPFITIRIGPLLPPVIHEMGRPYG